MKLMKKISPVRSGFAPSFVDYNKGCTRLATVSDKVYRLLAQGRWVSPGTPVSSTTYTSRHDICFYKYHLIHQSVWIRETFLDNMLSITSQLG